MLDKTLTGKIVRVETRRLGSVTSEPYAAGALALDLESVQDFHDAGGFFELGGVRLPYTGRDVAASQIVVGAGTLTAAGGRFLDVWVSPASQNRYAFVVMDDTAVTDLLVATIPHSLSGFVPYDGARPQGSQETAIMERVGNQITIRDIEAVQPLLDNNAIQPGAITTDKIGDYAVAVNKFKSNRHFLYTEADIS